MRIITTHPRIVRARWLRRQTGGGGAPKQSAQQSKNEKLQQKLMQAQLAQSQEKIDFPSIEPAAPLPPPPPPPTQTSADISEAEQQARRQALRRTSPGRSTIFAGATGGYKSGALGGTRTSLGGGG